MFLANKFYLKSFSSFLVLLFYLQLIPLDSALAKTTAPGSKKLDEAEEFYFLNRYDEAMTVLENCLQTRQMIKEDKIRAYKLVSLILLKTDSKAKAKIVLEKLLEIEPNFKPDQIFDPVEFFNLYAEVKGLFVSYDNGKAVNIAKDDTNSGKWFLLGSSFILAGSLLTAAFFSEGAAQ